jgi:hypothetical protein
VCPKIASALPHESGGAAIPTQFEGDNTIGSEKGWEESIQPKSNRKQGLEEAGGSSQSKNQKKDVS